MNRMNRDELMNWAADHYDKVQDCEGAAELALMAGWVNAMEVNDARQGIPDDEFVDLAYSEYDNMGYGRKAKSPKDGASRQAKFREEQRKLGRRGRLYYLTDEEKAWFDDELRKRRET